jgi:formate dehydrogenase subunit gamma
MSLGTSHSSRLTPIDPSPHGTATDLITRASELIADLQPDNADMIAGLHRVQHEFGYVPRQVIPLIAGRFRTTPALVFGMIDFYSELRTTPPAEDVVEWCSGPACLLKGSTNVRRALEATLGCGINEATPDGKLELRLVQCDGTCHLAPQVRHKGKYIGPLTVSEAIEWARALKGEPTPSAEDTPAAE